MCEILYCIANIVYLLSKHIQIIVSFSVEIFVIHPLPSSRKGCHVQGGLKHYCTCSVCVVQSVGDNKQKTEACRENSYLIDDILAAFLCLPL